MDMCGLSRCTLKIICRLSRVGNKSLWTSKKYQKCLERGIAQTRKLSTSAHGSDSCCNATTCLSVSVSGCVYLCVRTYATVRLPSHTAVWSVCDPQCHALNIVSCWVHKKKKKSQKATHVLLTCQYLKGDRSRRGYQNVITPFYVAHTNYNYKLSGRYLDWAGRSGTSRGETKWCVQTCIKRRKSQMYALTVTCSNCCKALKGSSATLFFFSAAFFTLSLFLQTAGKCWVTLWCISRRTTPVVHPGIKSSSSPCYIRSKYEGESWTLFFNSVDLLHIATHELK